MRTSSRKLVTGIGADRQEMTKTLAFHFTALGHQANYAMSL